MWQVAVLGAGMAGMACARMLARRGHRPLLIAPQTDVANRGETLSYRATPFLEALGWHALLDDNTATANQGRYSIWGGSALRFEVSDPDERAGWHIDRRRLEAGMAASINNDGVERLTGKVRHLSRSPDEVLIDIAGAAPIAANFVVDCTGRTAITSGATPAARRLDRLVACHATFDLEDNVEIVAATLVEAVATGWWYMSSIPGRRMLVGLFTDTDLLPDGLRSDMRLWAAMTANTHAVAARLESLGIDLTATSALHFAPASTVTEVRMVEPRIVRAGDAASALDPLGANGLATALWSGIQAAECVAGLLDGNETAALRYERQFLEGIASHLATQRVMYASEFRFADAPFWQRRRG